MADISKSYCLNHPDTPAVARCATCGKHVCAQCVVSRNGSSYCSKACADSAANTAGRVNTAVADMFSAGGAAGHSGGVGMIQTIAFRDVSHKKPPVWIVGTSDNE